MEPTELHAGDSAAWERDARAFPSAAGWSLTYVLRGPVGLDVVAEGGEPYRFAVSATDTAQLTAGTYQWACLALRGQERATVAKGFVKVLADLQSAGFVDGRSHAERMLDLIEAALEKRIPKDQQSYEIDGMRLDRIPIERLEALRTRYRREVASARRKGSPFGRYIRVRLR